MEHDRERERENSINVSINMHSARTNQSEMFNKKMTDFQSSDFYYTAIAPTSTGIIPYNEIRKNSLTERKRNLIKITLFTE